MKLPDMYVRIRFILLRSLKVMLKLTREIGSLKVRCLILRQILHILILVRFENEMMAKIININKRFK